MNTKQVEAEELVNKLKSETVGIYGFGRTGQAVARALLPVCRELLVLEDGEPQKFEDIREEWPTSLNWHFSPGELPPSIDSLIVSPGIPVKHPVLQQARERGVPVLGEVELAYQLCPGRVWAVTGTNGKSTCAELLGALLEAGENSAVVCGNRGKPFIEAVAETGEQEAEFVVEISSFQVQTMDRFTPDRSLLTNLGDDHQDRHQSLDQYFSLKWELLERTRAGGRIALPRELRSEWERRESERQQEVLYFDRNVVEGFEGHLRWTEDGLEFGEFFIPVENFPNILSLFPENLLAVVGLVQPRLEEQVFHQALTQFSVPPHRAEPVETGETIEVINDSKGTTPAAVEALVDSTAGDFSLILGGGEKSADFSDLFAKLAERKPDLHNLFLCGEADLVERLAELAERSEVDCRVVEAWEPGVKSLLRAATPGETVLLSPGATSFDAFEDYRERGRKFRRWTKEVFFEE